jgi:solute carrier family 45 protein 3
MLQFLLDYPHQLCAPVLTAPAVLRRLFFADLLSWMAVMAHAMYCTDYVATAVYGGRADAEPGSREEARFDEGVRMGSWGLLMHSVTGESHLVFDSTKINKLVDERLIFGQ